MTRTEQETDLCAAAENRIRDETAYCRYRLRSLGRIAKKIGNALNDEALITQGSDRSDAAGKLLDMARELLATAAEIHGDARALYDLTWMTDPDEL